jgi:simple sugar transport system ATP-binding protein
MGIETIYQETSLVDQLTVARNIFLGREPTKMSFINKLDTDYMRAESTRLLGRIGLHKVNPDSLPPTLSGGEKQSIAIARGMYFKASLLVLDEPTNHLGIEESDRVLEFVKEAKKEGTSTIFITHNISHVYQIADRFVVLRNGKKVGDARKEETTINEVSNLITGREIS